jgi:hypothetical protein
MTEDDWWNLVNARVNGALTSDYVCAYVDGAAVAFGIMGMAEAIREHEARKRYETLLAFNAGRDIPGFDEPCSWCAAAAYRPCLDWCGANKVEPLPTEESAPPPVPEEP